MFFSRVDVSVSTAPSLLSLARSRESNDVINVNASGKLLA